MTSPMQFLLLKPTPPRISRNTVQSDILSVKGIQRLARVIFLTGPRLMLTSRLSRRSATYMIMLCVPAIVLFISTTLPRWLFQSPDQEAYFYFAGTFTQDLSKGYLLVLSALCMLLVLAMPATSPEPHTAVRN